MSTRGRPRTEWTGKFGSFVSSYSVAALADEINVDYTTVKRWLRGDAVPSVPHAIAILKVARSAGTRLELEDIYVREEKTTDGLLSKAAQKNRAG